MKKNDIALLVLIVASVALLVYLSLNLFMGGSQTAKSVDVKVVKPISSEIVPPSAKIFNEQAINPTVPITIESGNQKPIGN